MSKATVIIAKFAHQYGIDESKVFNTLKKTAFRQKKGEITDEQMISMLIVANEYNLNPFTREIYAFQKDENSAIVPIVPVDGWMKIINGHCEMDGMTFADSFDIAGKIASVTCSIYRKDRSHATEVTEYLSECKRNTGPWTQWPARMLRHKAAIQCARYAFSFTGINDPDEGDRIAESGKPASINEDTFIEGEIVDAVDDAADDSNQSPAYSEISFNNNLASWTDLVFTGSHKASAIIERLEKVATLTDDQKKTLEALPIDGEQK
jgi:phage recombination protein Bet